MRLSQLSLIGLVGGAMLLVYACSGSNSADDSTANSPDASAGGGATNHGGSAGTSGASGTGGTSVASGGAGASGRGNAGASGDVSVAGAAGSGDTDAPLTIFSGSGKPTGIALAGNTVYWADEAQGTVSSCPKTGCGSSGPTNVAAVAAPRGLALHGDTLYVISAGNADASATSTVEQCTLGACSAAQIVDLGGSIVGPFGGAIALAVDDNFLYISGGPSLGSCPLTGCAGAPATVLGFLSGGPHFGVAVDATTLYTSSASRGLGACPLTGCATAAADVALVVTPPALAIAVDETNLYWSEFQFLAPNPDLDSAIRTCAKSGCELAAATVLTAGFIEPYALAVDDQDLFFTDYRNGRVERIPKLASNHACSTAHLTSCCTGDLRCDDTCSVACGEGGAGGVPGP
ncbi:MAG TPA: hypothetical protein VGI10_14845 [Polyangiaceae bacterium]|jgi:hypothetical protein